MFDLRTVIGKKTQTLGQKEEEEDEEEEATNKNSPSNTHTQTEKPFFFWHMPIKSWSIPTKL
jgi:hypothetical protein